MYFVQERPELGGKMFNLIERKLLNQLTKEGIYGMAYREYMDILSFEELHGKSRRSH